MRERPKEREKEREKERVKERVKERERREREDEGEKGTQRHVPWLPERQTTLMLDVASGDYFLIVNFF